MKTLFKSLLIFLFFIVQNISAQNITKSTFKVKGECGMCKDRIETTAKEAGATYANWNEETQQLSVAYNESKLSATQLLKKIADVGHDNEQFTALDSVYENLPACCHYERTPSFLKAEPKTESLNPANTGNRFFVMGNCGSCKARIEKAAKEAGAASADWDAETQTVILDFDPKKTSADAVLKKIAEVGHDNEKYRAPDEVYKNLPDCCLYDRELPLGVKSALVHQDGEEQHNDDNANTIEVVNLTKLEEATALSKKNAALTFNIGSKELLKAACCNLSESFETNATVDVSFSNAVTGTKQLKMLGLDQKYTSLTKELLPEIRGLASAYGLNFIPGRWIGGIQLTKGGSTVTNGYESITGQINTELLKFDKTPETNLNVFADANSRVEMNITSTSALSEKWNQSLLLHGNATLTEMDTNDDGFMDQPTGNQLNVAYLLNYNDLDKSGLGSHFGINFLKDSRNAGQMGYDKKLDQSEQNLYGVGIDISRFQVWNKTGYIFKGKPYQSIGLMNQFTYHQQDSFFGLRNYFGKQNTFYSNLIFESIIGNTNHKYKTGASFLYDRFNEDYLTDNFKRTETVPGLFFEYTQTGAKYTLVAGARADFHNLAGTQFTPRLNFKYDFTPKTIVRLSAGRGFRTANVFAENQQYFASNRKIEILGNGGEIYNLKPEIAWNYGISLQQEFKLFSQKATLVADFFRTDFQDQVLADLDASPQKIVFYNLAGNSFANSFQTQLDFSVIKNLDFRMAYKYYDVQADFMDGRREIPFMAKNRGFFNASYATVKDKKDGFWSFDTTLQYVGRQKLPNLNGNPTEFQLPEYSDSYVTLNAQVSKDFNKNIRMYAGGENLTGYTQNNVIIDAQNPFSNYFDGGMVYGPIMPANFYVGVDLKF
ncbi:TonB-dependent receptor domain-containing protein [Chryseobacterium sp.]|uniref:TonB-dependent receptor domain-containing protein n=1 Tax=Chryseobacterium sp. TaxID=1871047 RepID=UPI0011CB110C|nr:TonB-dependent receptor [Chryseobacterium sp.]TXF76125.1 TonB-dependent receptor [Chryseobacterium sp.]